MRFVPFELDAWLNRFAGIECDLAASTGPIWTLDDLISLDGGNAIREQLGGAALYYGPAEGDLVLREAIAQLYGPGVTACAVQVTIGAQGALAILFALAAEPGANVVVPAPGFPAYTAVARALGLDTRRYPLRVENDFRPLVEEILERIDGRTTLVLVNSPHNPSGATLPSQDLDRLITGSRRWGASVVCDEVYHPLYLGAAEPTAARHEEIIVVSSLSKAFGLSGLRVGWIVDRDPVRRRRYPDAHAYLAIAMPALCELLGLHALRHREALLARAKTVIARNVGVFRSLVEAFPEQLGWVPPSGGTTAFPWLRQSGDATDLCETAAANGVLLAPGRCFGAPRHFRVGFGAEAAAFRTGVERLGEILGRRST